MPERPTDATLVALIREATDPDASAIASLYLASRKIHLPYAKVKGDDADVETWIRERLIPKGEVYVLEIESDILAFAALSRSAKESWIDQLYVAPDQVGLGHGAYLLRFALKRLPPPVFAYAFQRNRGARLFYERHGFRAVSFTDGQQNEESCPDVLYRYP